MSWGGPFRKNCSAQGDMAILKSGCFCSKHGYTVLAHWPHAPPRKLPIIVTAFSSVSR